MVSNKMKAPKKVAPFYGARRLRDAMWDEHRVIVNRKRVRRLIKLMGLCAIYPGNKGTSAQ